MNVAHRGHTAVVAAVLGLTLVASANAATSLYWDTDGSGASGNPPTSGVGGAGTWDTTSSNWWNGTSYTTWAAASPADFRGTAGTVTLATGGVVANSLSFGVSGYTIAGTDTLGLGNGTAGTVTVGSGISATISAPIKFDAGGSSQNITVTGGGSLTMSGNLSSTYINYLVVTGASATTGSTLTLSGYNTQGGNILMRGGLLNIGAAHALNNATINFNTTAGGPNRFDNTSGAPLSLTTTNTLTVGTDITFVGTDSLTTSGPANLSGTATRTITVNNNTLKLNGVLGGATAPLVKAGAGTLELTANNTFSNALSVTDGTLLASGTGNLNAASSITVNGANAALRYSSTTALTKSVAFGASGGKFVYDSATAYAQALSISTGATLGGSGNISGAVTITGGTLAPGNSPGTLNTGTLTMDSAALLSYDLNAADHSVGSGVNDEVVVNGDLTLDGTINLAALTELTAGQYTLMHYTGALTDNGLAIGNNFGTASNQQYSIAIDTDNKNVNLVVVVPEPAAMGLIGSGLLLGFARRRRVA